MKTILFDIYPAQSHINCTLKVANLLKQNGYRVIYSGVKEYEGIILKSGFEYRVINPFILTSILELRYQSKGWFFLENVTNLFNKTRLAEAKDGFRNLQELISELKPDAVILDIHKVILKAPFYRLHKIPVVSVHTTFEVKKMPNVPPITSYFVPRENVFSYFYTSLLFFKAMARNRTQFWWLQIKYLRQGEFGVVRNFYKEHGIQLGKEIDLDRSFGLGLKNLPRIILAPTPLDFQTSKWKNTFSLGPLIDVNREGLIGDSRYSSLIERIKQKRAKGNSFVIYCSMGTLAGLAKKKTNRFFKRMVRVANLNPDFLFVLSTGTFFDVNELLPVPVNMFVFEFVPQIDLLKHVDVMITHGGASSLAECVMNEVPMIVYPFMKQTDIPSNSARVVFHKIGLRGNITLDSARKISRKINQIKSNYQFYLEFIRQMKQKFEEKNNSAEVVNVIESIINNHEN